MKHITIARIVTLAATGVLCGCDKITDAPSPAPPARAAATNQTAPLTPPNAAFERLTGKWLRPDGGYVIEIMSAAADGKLDARYFNPRPINVAKAEASIAGETVTVFVELRDVNYPGSTYTLTYDPGNDRLAGDYFQAALRQTFDVHFVRMTP